jgi:cell division protein FtsL
MKRNLSGHVGKTRSEKQFYSDYIKSKDYTPTVDDSLKFNETTDDENEFALEKNKKRRKRPIGEILSEKWEEYWFHVISGIVALVLSFFMIDAKVGLAQLFERTNNINSNVNEVKSLIKETKDEINNSLEKIEDANHQQDLLIKENQIKIEHENKNGK